MIKPPSKATLRRYGLDEVSWRERLPPDGLCPVCKRPLEQLRVVIDHEHVPKWRKLPPAERKRHVRSTGLCNYCNFRLLRKGLTLERARRIVAYLEAHERASAQSGAHESSNRSAA